MNRDRLLTSTFTAVLLMASAARAQTAYVTNADITNNDPSVSVIDTPSNTIVATVPLLVPVSTPEFVAVTPDGSRVYVGNEASSNVSVIDTTNNTVVNTVGVGSEPVGMAVTPDGRHVYVANEASSNVSVIDTTSNTVVATVPVPFPAGVAITPDGTQAYVTTGVKSLNPLVFNNIVSVIDTSSNTVVATVTLPANSEPFGVTVTPDGRRVYVANGNASSVSVIDTSSKTVVATVQVGTDPAGVAVTPDGRRVYVTNIASNSVSVIDTFSNTVNATVMVGTSPIGVAITADGTRAYVANDISNNVSVIDTSSNTIVDTVPGFSNPVGVAICPVPFSVFSANLDLSSAGFALQGTATLASGGTINPPTQLLTLGVGTYTVTVPAGSFNKDPHGMFTFEGTINGVALQIRIAARGGNSYSIQLDGSGVDLTGLTNPVTVTLTIGNNTGTTSVNANF